jgi:2-methylfumaryl-CoA isomerase
LQKIAFGGSWKLASQRRCVYDLPAGIGAAIDIAEMRVYEVLNGLRVVEAASFIAGPSCGLHLAQMGAEVIRIDPIGGGPDRHRWPRAADGASLYWEGLNKGKKSVVVDLSRPEGRELAQRLATGPGDNAGLFVTNFPEKGFLGHATLAKLRGDLISLRIAGWGNGDNGVDYTINAAAGIPLMTGPASMGDQPVNAALPAWDLLAGAYGAFSLLAAERSRRTTGIGGEIRLPLGDLAAATLGNLGQLAEVLGAGVDRERTGNDLYGAFGRDFVTADGKRLMIVAMTARQWSDLVSALGVGDAVAAVEASLGLSFATDEGLRYSHRSSLFPIVEAAFARHDFATLEARFAGTGVCWGPYRSVREAAQATDRFAMVTPWMTEVAHPSGAYPTPGSAASFSWTPRSEAAAAPRLGAHTDEVLGDVLGLPGHEIARLHDAGLVASAG